MKKHGKLLLKYLLLFVMTVFVMGCFSVSAATKTGFVTQKGKTYYINKDGSKQKGWLMGIVLSTYRYKNIYPRLAVMQRNAE